MTDSPLDRLTGLFGEMPGIGKKTAQRLSYFVLNREPAYAEALSLAVKELRQNLRWCARCYNLSETELCHICRQSNRDLGQLCVVEDAANVSVVERSGGYQGLYHVLQGVLSPMNGIGPDELRMQELTARLDEGGVRELILATNPTVEGEATAMYIAGMVEHREGLKVSRIGVGVPIGGSIDFVDEITMAKAFENRRIL